MPQVPLIPVDLPPGVARNGTRYQVGNRWYDASLVRWLDGIMQPVGGWTSITTSPIAHPARGMVAWATNSGGRWYAIGTSTKLHVGRGDTSLFDVTPGGFTSGNDNAVEQLGYGGSTYGTGTYGTQRPSGNFIPPTTWTLDTWGDHLVGSSTSDGKAYEWALATGTPAAAITNAPTSITSLVVTDQRHLMVFYGRTAQWSGVENNTLWTPAANNEAGQIQFVTNGTVVRGVRVRGQILVLTTVDAHAMTYIGQPFIWSRSPVGDKCGVIGPNAVVVAGGRAFWMSDKRFWMYDGSAVQELPCEVADFVFNGMNKVQGAKVFAGSNGLFEEVHWHYCSTNANEPDRYVAFNYRMGYWMIGALTRAAWADKGAFPNPMAVGGDGLVYVHETGQLANGASRVGTVYAETGALELGHGDRVTDLNQILTDEKTKGDTQISFTSRYVPNGDQYAWGPFQVRTDGYMDARVSGRQLVMRLDALNDNAWQLGKMRFDATATSGR
jgi:hypothetical protein